MRVTNPKPTVGCPLFGGSFFFMIPRGDEVWSPKPPLQVRYNRGLIPAKYLSTALMSRNHCVCSYYSWLKSCTFRAVGEIISVLPSLTRHVCFQKYLSFFLKVDVSSHQTNMSMSKKDCQQTSSVSLHPPFVGIPHPFIVSPIAEAAALLATGTGRQDLLRAFCRLCRASALALRGARRRGDGERLPRRHIFGGKFCVYHKEHGEPQQNGGDWFRWFSLFSWVKF